MDVNVLTIQTVKYGVNGITNVVKNYYKFLDKEKVHMDFLFLNQPDEDFSRTVKENGNRIFVSHNRNRNPIKYSNQLMKIIKKNNYEIIHIHGNSNTLAIELSIAKKVGVPIRIAHSHNTFTKFPVLNRLLSMKFKNTVTHGVACGVEAGKWMFKNKHFEVLDNGIDSGIFKFSNTSRTELRKELSLAPEDIVIGHIGHFTEQKNQKFFISFCKHLKMECTNFKFLLIGDGSLRADFEKELKVHDLYHNFIVLGNRDDIPKLMSAMDILIMPSLYEGLPLTLVEAQAADLPCLVSNNITKEVNITGEVQFFDLKADLNDLKIQMLSLLTSVEKRSALINNKLINDSKYDIRVGVEKLQQLYSMYLTD